MTPRKQPFGRFQADTTGERKAVKVAREPGLGHFMFGVLVTTAKLEPPDAGGQLLDGEDAELICRRRRHERLFADGGEIAIAVLEAERAAKIAAQELPVFGHEFETRLDAFILKRRCLLRH